MKHLTEAQVEAWRTQGFLSPLTAMDESEARGFRDRLEASERAFGPLKIGGMGSKSHLLFSWVDEIARHPRVLDAVEDLIGGDILIYTLTLWLKGAKDGEGTLLDNSMVVYGSSISDGNKHEHLNLPTILAGGGGGKIHGGRHVRFKKGTPMTNLLVTLLDKLGVEVGAIGDSTGRLVPDHLSNV